MGINCNFLSNKKGMGVMVLFSIWEGGRLDLFNTGREYITAV